MTTDTMPPDIQLSAGRNGRRRPDFPWTVEIRHPQPDPFDYCIHARTALDATAIVSHMRQLGRGAAILEVDA